jgi:undecaprenyl-diphosphatase
MLPFDWIRALVLGLVEGATEFIPVSSTGHLILVGHWLNFIGDRAAVFEVVIQLGAILAVVWQYRAMLLKLAADIPSDRNAQHTTMALFVAFLPAAVVGFLTHKWITAHLFRPVTVAIALVVGGVFILVVERFRPAPRDEVNTQISLKTALGIGVAQILALFPGFSRSAATIMGGLALGVDRPAATEFSFLLALPIMFAATGLDLVTHRDMLSRADVPMFAIGLVTAFVSALVVIRILIRFVANHTFRGFAWYRIALGAALLVAMQMGVLAL